MQGKTVAVTFESFPATPEDIWSMPQGTLATPFETAALTVLALAYYPSNKDLSLGILKLLKGPAGLSEYEKQFIRDRFMDKDYVPRSYFDGATPQNDYAPRTPWTVRVQDNPYSYQDQGWATLYVTSGGADSPRPIKLRLAKDGKWFLEEQFILADIRKPESENPWA